ncbi:hypothetical protein [Pontibacter sp. G13]|uniref:hypothetical protein n=1 Tax=Pontibacter sp. G13 TaxID=3074898 RepID=UPI00288AD057|nr:hypothetical protein [Pontibacter sp. G13]WNJ21552.1 hypothetical protein RJD25_28750 [Pontibacter sp. G13]
MKSPLQSIISAFIWCLSISFLSAGSLSAANESYVEVLQGSQIGTGAILNFQDAYFAQFGPNYSSSGAFFNDQICRNTIMLRLNLNAPDYIQNEVKVRVVFNTDFQDNMGGSFSLGQQSLEISHDPVAGGESRARDYIQFQGGYSGEISIAEIHLYIGGIYQGQITNAPSWVDIEVRTDIERYYDFDREAVPSGLQVVDDPANGELVVSWDELQGAEDYDLEWVFIDDYSIGGNAPGTAFSFDREAVRVNVSSNSYRIDNIFKSGNVLFRVRGVGRSIDRPGQPITGYWTVGSEGDLTQSPSGLVAHPVGTGFESNLNWQYQSTFIEGGKHKNVISYHDGTLRNRQSITKLNTPANGSLGQQGYSIVQETIYDFQGRPAVQVLPVPGPVNRLDYQNLFNRSAATPTEAYSFKDFEYENTPGVITINSMAPGHGAANYYSSSNPDQEGAQAFIPESGGFPFTVTQYTADQTGRVRSQSGVGEDFRIGSGHETSYLYGIPYQEELDALFGTNVGYAKRYQKQVVVDPNGQSTISILDYAGKTIATALSGQSPDNLDALASNSSQPIEINLSAFNDYQLSGQAWVSSFTHIQVAPGDIELNYELTPGSLSGSCGAGTYCYECVYNFNLSITDQETGEVIFSHDEQLGPTVLDDQCNSPSVISVLNGTVVPNLEPGRYLFKKKLSVYDNALSEYLELYLTSSPCVEGPGSFNQNAYASVDVTGCNITPCEAICLATHGETLEEYQVEHPGATHLDWQNALAQCEVECDGPLNECEAIYRQMLLDVSPGGQYALYTELSDGTYEATESLSVLNTQTNILGSPGGNDHHYSDPGISYLNSDNTPALVNGNSPNQLSLEEFIDNWDPHWARQLVEFHPEFCLVEGCIDPSGSGSMGASQIFDQELQDYDTYDNAFGANIFTGSSSDLVANLVNNDPYFQDPVNSAAKADMLAIVHTFMETLDNGTTYSWSMAEFVAKYVECGEPVDVPSFDSCPATLFQYDCDQNAQWNMLRGLYLGEKAKIVEAQLQQNGDCSDLTDTQLEGKIRYGMGLEATFGSAILQDLMSMGTPNTPPPSVENAMTEQCQSVCDSYEPYWRAQLESCATNGYDIDAIIQEFKDICMCGCDNLHPLGTSSVSPSQNCNLDNNNFKEVLASHGISADPLNQFDPTCNAFLISMPPPHETNGYGGNSPFPVLDTCSCEAISSSYVDYQAAGGQGGTGKTEEEYFEDMTGIYVSDMEGKRCKCDEAFAEDYGTPYMDGVAWGIGADAFLSNLGIPVPDDIACSRCMGCGDVAGALLGYETLVDGPNGDLILTNAINQQLGMNLTWDQYETFLEECTTISDCSGLQKLDELQPFLNAALSAPGNDLIAEGLNLSAMPYSQYFTGQLASNLVCGTGNITYSSNILFSRIYDKNVIDIIATQDEGYLVLLEGQNWTTFAQKMNKEHEVEWTVEIAYPLLRDYTKVIQTSDGGYFIAGIRSYSGTAELISAKLDNSGVVIGTDKLIGTFNFIVGLDELVGSGQIFLAAQEGSTTLLLEYNLNASYSGTSFTRISGTKAIAGGGQEPESDQLAINSAGQIALATHDAASQRLTIHFFDSSLSPQGSSLEFPDNQNVSILSDANTFHVFSNGRYGLEIMSLDWGGTNWAVTLNRLLTIPSLSSGGKFGGIIDRMPNGDFSVAMVRGEVITLVKFDPGFSLQWAEMYTMSGSTEYPLVFDTNTEGRFLLSAPDDPRNLFNVIEYQGKPEASCLSSETGAFIDPALNPVVNLLVTPISTIPPTPVGTSFSSFPSQISMTPTCSEILIGMFTNACGDECVMELSLPGTGTDETFDNLASVGNIAFTATGEISMSGTLANGSNLLVTGTHSCIDNCDEFRLCNEAIFPEIPVPADDCEGFLQASALQSAQLQFQNYVDGLKLDFVNEYLDACLLKIPFQEVYNMSYENHEHHFTLYHYDQAGNLVQTVPPEGVDRNLSPSFLTQVGTARDNGTELLPEHTLKTQYQYNSLNQMVRKITPDEGDVSTPGVTEFWYDALGRLVVSQDAEHRSNGLYSYTVYDDLGRISEAGLLNPTGTMTNAIAADQVALSAWVSSGSKQEVTRTHYDSHPAGLNLPFASNDHNLRNRIATVEYEYLAEGAYLSRIHYSYDSRGNVKSLIRDFPELADIGHQFKRIDYHYDLLSGNVLQVDYQDGHPDCFYHRYKYDADNRIQEVYTSTDNVHFDREAGYQYYAHGPLARQEIGAWDVQGMDYAYTIQGWLKGVNASTLDMTRDMGKDGASGNAYHSGMPDVHYLHGRDAFGFSLGYYEGDYASISAPATADRFEASTATIYANVNDLSLYNGNIGLMQTALSGLDAVPLPEQLTHYRYDQLQRIKAMKAVQDPGLPASNEWATASSLNGGDYRTSYSYDANGNLLSLDRNAAGGSSVNGMDALTYNYDHDPITGKLRSNRLGSVADAQGQGWQVDIGNQPANNYAYDLAGNLVFDQAEGIAQINWNAARKISSVLFADPTRRDLWFQYDPLGNRIRKRQQSKDLPPEVGSESSWYVRDAQGNNMAIYERYMIPIGDLEPPTSDDFPEGFDNCNCDHVEVFVAAEYELYGSKRLGNWLGRRFLTGRFYDSSVGTTGSYTGPIFDFPEGYHPDRSNPTAPEATAYGGPLSAGTFSLGHKRFEGTNHLGNVLSVFSDRKLQIPAPGMQYVDGYTAEIYGYSDYFPFGMLMPGRNGQRDGYRYGFQGQETDDEVYGKGNAVSYKYRVHDARIGRFLSIDPLAPEYPFYSPYAFSGNRVIDAVELEGLEPSCTQAPIEIRPELGKTSVAPDGTLVDSDGVPVAFYDVGDEVEVIAERTKPSFSPGFRILSMFAFFMSLDMSSNSRGATTRERRRIDDERRREEGRVDFALGLGGLKMEGRNKADPMSNLMIWAGYFLMSEGETADTYWDRDGFTGDPRVDVLYMMNETIAKGNKLHFRLDGLGLTGLDGAQEEDTWDDLPKTIQGLRERLNTQGRSEGSYTIYELQQVMSNPTYLENTQFWLNNQRISTEHVKELLGEIVPPSE